MNNKKVSLNDILERISKIEARLEEIAPISKRKLPSKKEQIQAFKDAERICFNLGLTTVDDAGLSKQAIEIIDTENVLLLKMIQNNR